MRDGLYRVVTPHFVAGFVVRDGCVCECAPILRASWPWSQWLRLAQWVCP